MIQPEKRRCASSVDIPMECSKKNNYNNNKTCTSIAYRFLDYKRFICQYLLMVCVLQVMPLARC